MINCIVIIYRVNWDRRTKGQGNVIKRKEKPGHHYVSVKLIIIFQTKVKLELKLELFLRVQRLKIFIM